MASGDLSKRPGPVDEPADSADLPTQLQALRHERDALEVRAVEAETLAERLAGDLMDARRLLADQQPGPAAADDASGAGRRAGDVPLVSSSRLLGDGSDAGVLPIALLGTALVMGLVFVLSLVNNGVLSVATVLFLLITAGLGYGAWVTRVVRTSIHIDDGTVHVVRGRAEYHFDLTSNKTVVTLVGTPGERGFKVRFERRVLDSVEIDGTLIDDPVGFVAQLREYRPEI